MRNKKPGKIQELIYELKVRDIMKKEVISVSPELSMRALREILRKNRISGVPVIDDDKVVVGIISLEDFINWLSGYKDDACVGEWMTRDVVTVYHDDPLIAAIGILEKYGYGRLPVVTRKEHKLVGILSKGVIIEGLLKELEIGYQEEEIHHYRASHFFEDVIADRVTIGLFYHVKGGDYKRGGEVAGKIKRTLKRLGIKPEIYRRIAIAVYEAEMNLIFYTDGGDITIFVRPDKICVEARDDGPGIPNVQEALKPGFSTAPEWVRELGFGAGIGLNNIQKCSDEMVIESVVGKGTELALTINVE